MSRTSAGRALGSGPLTSAEGMPPLTPPPAAGPHAPREQPPRGTDQRAAAPTSGAEEPATAPWAVDPVRRGRLRRAEQLGVAVREGELTDLGHRRELVLEESDHAPRPPQRRDGHRDHAQDPPRHAARCADSHHHVPAPRTSADVPARHDADRATHAADLVEAPAARPPAATGEPNRPQPGRPPRVAPPGRTPVPPKRTADESSGSAAEERAATSPSSRPGLRSSGRNRGPRHIALCGRPPC
jgi:hypothetical protein